MSGLRCSWKPVLDCRNDWKLAPQDRCFWVNLRIFHKSALIFSKTKHGIEKGAVHQSNHQSAAYNPPTTYGGWIIQFRMFRVLFFLFYLPPSKHHKNSVFLHVSSSFWNPPFWGGSCNGNASPIYLLVETLLRIPACAKAFPFKAKAWKGGKMPWRRFRTNATFAFASTLLDKTIGISNILTMIYIWLVVSTHLKNIGQIGSFPQVRVNIKKNIWNHHLVYIYIRGMSNWWTWRKHLRYYNPCNDMYICRSLYFYIIHSCRKILSQYLPRHK